VGRLPAPPFCCSTSGESRKGDVLSTHNLRPDVQDALNDCYEEFKISLGRFGHALHVLCYDRLLSERLPELQNDDWQAWRQAWLKIRSDDYEASLNAFDEWMSAHAELRIHFDLTGHDTPSAVFRAFFDFYIGLIAVEARRIFADLIKFGRAVAADGVAWAKEQASFLTRHYRYLVIEWVRIATDKQGDRESWQASLFLTMQPAGRNNYDSERAWERMDAASSQKALDTFADEYVERLESYIREDARATRLAAFDQLKLAGKRKVTERSLPGTRQGGADVTTRRERGRQARERVKTYPRHGNVVIPLAAEALERSEGAIRRNIREGKKLIREGGEKLIQERGKLIQGGAPGTVNAGSLQDLIDARFPLEAHRPNNSTA